MRAIRVGRFGGPEEMELADVPAPEAEARTILIAVKAAGVNPVDTYIRTGTHAIRPALPYTPGFDGAGVVASVDSAVHAFRPGDRVYFNGTLTGSYAQFALSQPDQVHPLPSHVSFAEGAALGIPCVTAYRALFELGAAQAGETVLVRGASGTVGLAAVQFAAAAGLRVIGTASSAPSRAVVQQQGAGHVLDHQGPTFATEVLAATGGVGVDLIIEMLANANLGNDLTLLASRGRIVVVGSRGPVQINPREAMVREATIRSVFFFNSTTEQLDVAHRAIGAALAVHTLRPLVAQEFALTQAAQAHEAVLATHAPGKIVLVP